MFADLVRQNRTVRRFRQDEPVAEATLRELVDLARLSASGGNRQPLKYVLSCDPDKNARIFPHLAWAGSLKDWPGPAEGERPAAYILILLDKELRPNAGVDHGIAAQSITLGACEKGLGCCMMGAIQRQNIKEELGIPERYDLLLVLAIGRPAEQVVIDDAAPGGDVTYYRDENDVHHVPKRTLDEIIIG